MLFEFGLFGSTRHKCNLNQARLRCQNKKFALESLTNKSMSYQKDFEFLSKFCREKYSHETRRMVQQEIRAASKHHLSSCGLKVNH